MATFYVPSDFNFSEDELTLATGDRLTVNGGNHVIVSITPTQLQEVNGQFCPHVFRVETKLQD
jgi:urease accessory protein UreE